MIESKSNDSGIVKPQLTFVNRGLFSDHYLKERLPEREEWKVNSKLAIFRNELLALYQAKKSILSHLNEAQTEDEFIKPLLDLLGFTDSYIVQAATKLGLSKTTFYDPSLTTYFDPPG